MRILALSATLGILAGCVGPLVPVVNIEKLTPKDRHETLSLPIYNEGQLTGKKYTIVNVVEGISCKNKTWDHPATRTDAITQAKYWAKSMGATAITNMQCDHPRGTTTTYNCWESITCTGQAIVIE